MASSVRALSNHYETLEVAPNATSDEIVGAFAAHMRAARLRPDITVARLAQLSVAYEILRDPVKRRAYDSTIGLRKEPASSPPEASPFLGPPIMASLNRLAEHSLNPNSQQKAPPAAKIPTEPRVAAFIASSLREPVRKAEPERAAPSSKAEPHPPEWAAEPLCAPSRESLELEDGRMSIGRTGATFAAGVIGVAVLAFAVALPERNPDRLSAPAAHEEPGVTVPLPPAAAAQGSFVVARAPSTTATTSTTIAATASPRASNRLEHGPAAKKPRPVPWRGLDKEQASASSAEEAQAQTPSVENAVQKSHGGDPAAELPAIVTAEAASVSTAMAKMPLPNATIAHTIERIGYDCGRVVSTSNVEGNGGVFNITCSSGDRYRAAPVRGRYHFRRLASH